MRARPRSGRVLVLSDPSTKTGKTTVARLYAQLLHQAGALPADTFEETSGAKLLAGFTASCRGTIGQTREEDAVSVCGYTGTL